MTTIYHQKPWLKYYPDGVPEEIEVPVKTITQLFDESAEKWKNKTAIIFYGKKIKYAELKDHIDRFATALHDLGIKKGDTVAILMLNTPQYVIAYYGALKIGAKLTLISPMYVSPEIRHQVEDSGAKDIICLNLLYDAVKKTGLEFRNVILTDMGEYLPRLKKILGKSILSAVYEKGALPPADVYEEDNVYKMWDLITKYPPQPPDLEIDPKKDLVALQYTGGTTALPKAAVLTHYNYVANEAQIFSWFKDMYEEGNEVMLAYMPFYHAAGQLYLIQGLIRGFTLVVESTTDLNQIIDDMQNYSVTVFMGAPAIYDALKNYERTNRINWKKLKTVVCGADALLLETSSTWEKRTGRRICEGYGMSEAAGVVCINPPGRIKLKSFGLPIPSTTVAILDSEKDEFLPLGEVGEIAITGPQVMSGYWNDPEESQKKYSHINGESWMRSGDLGNMDEEGYFYFYDRKKDMIKYKGHAVFAREIEDVIKNHPCVNEVGVVGVKDAQVGEMVKAVIVLESDARGTVSEDDIVEYCQDKLAYFKIPKIIEFKGEIPKTDVGKVSRRELREEVE